MRIFLSFLLVLLGTIGVSAQINATVYPSETYIMETIDYDGWSGVPYTYEKNIDTGKANRLAFSAYNPSTQAISMSFTCVTWLDGYKTRYPFVLDPYHQSDRYEVSCTPVFGYSNYWETEITVTYPVSFKFDAYWIYQVLNL